MKLAKSIAGVYPASQNPKNVPKSGRASPLSAVASAKPSAAPVQPPSPSPLAAMQKVEMGNAGVPEQIGADTVTVPRSWQSAPDHPKTMLAYITEEEAALLKQADIHGSGVGTEDHFGPGDVPSFNGGGSTYGQDNYNANTNYNSSSSGSQGPTGGQGSNYSSNSGYNYSAPSKSYGAQSSPSGGGGSQGPTGGLGSNYSPGSGYQSTNAGSGGGSNWDGGGERDDRGGAYNSGYGADYGKSWSGGGSERDDRGGPYNSGYGSAAPERAGVGTGGTRDLAGEARARYEANNPGQKADLGYERPEKPAEPSIDRGRPAGEVDAPSTENIKSPLDSWRAGNTINYYRSIDAAQGLAGWGDAMRRNTAFASDIPGNPTLSNPTDEPSTQNSTPLSSMRTGNILSSPLTNPAVAQQQVAGINDLKDRVSSGLSRVGDWMKGNVAQSRNGGVPVAKDQSRVTPTGGPDGYNGPLYGGQPVPGDATAQQVIAQDPVQFAGPLAGIADPNALPGSQVPRTAMSYEAPEVMNTLAGQVPKDQSRVAAAMPAPHDAVAVRDYIFGPGAGLSGGQYPGQTAQDDTIARNDYTPSESEGYLDPIGAGLSGKPLPGNIVSADAPPADYPGTMASIEPPPADYTTPENVTSTLQSVFDTDGWKPGAFGPGGDHDPPVLIDPTKPGKGGGKTPPVVNAGPEITPPDIKPWDMKTYNDINARYAKAGISYTPADFINDMYGPSRALANPSINVPRSNSIG